MNDQPRDAAAENIAALSARRDPRNLEHVTLDAKGWATVLAQAPDDAIVTEYRTRAKAEAEHNANAFTVMAGQTYLGDRFTPATCNVNRCQDWARGDVLHRHWRDQATGFDVTTATSVPPSDLTPAGVTTIEHPVQP